MLGTLWCVFLFQLTLGDEELWGKGKSSSHDAFSGSTSTFSQPYSYLNEYHNLQDTKIYTLNVPVYVSKMELTFIYIGFYSGSKKPCNNTITVLLQHGSPAVPYRDAIKTKDFLYNNSDIAYKTMINLGKQEKKIITSPLPGVWYVTAFIPYVEKVKKIKEMGLSKPDENCLCALEVLKVLESPSQAAVVIGRNQTLKITSNISEQTVKYYMYFVPDYSKRLTIQLRNNCPLKTNNCSLRLSVSAKALPSSHAFKNCTTNDSDGCMIHIEWPQPATNYYIKVSGTSSLYEITANHTDCQQLSCLFIYEMSDVIQRRLENRWPEFILNTTQAIFSLEVLPNYVGTTLFFGVMAEPTDDNATYKMCIRKDYPTFELQSTSPSQQYCSSKNINDSIIMQVLFPQSGKWYIGISIQSATHNPELAMIRFLAGTNACLDPYCSGHGSCVVTNDVGISYGVCVCDYGYSGWTCADYHGIDILAICLLTISNIAFLPGIIVAWKRKFYPEAVVYLFNMYCSTVYHACDSHGRCIYDYNTLQLSDFFASVLSVWFTFMTMVKLTPLWHRTINILALFGLFIGVQVSRFGVTVIAVPAGVGLGIVFTSFLFRCYYRQKLYPSRKRWLFFILPGAVLATVAVCVYTLLETTANYKYLHSIWHICIALCIPLLLPSVRKARLYVEYNMIQQLDECENFDDNADSLLLNSCNTAQNNDDEEEPGITAGEPRLVGENTLACNV